MKKEIQTLTKSIVSNMSGESDIKRKIMDSIKEIESKIIRIVGERIDVNPLK